MRFKPITRAGAGEGSSRLQDVFSRFPGRAGGSDTPDLSGLGQARGPEQGVHPQRRTLPPHPAPGGGGRDQGAQDLRNRLLRFRPHRHAALCPGGRVGRYRPLPLSLALLRPDVPDGGPAAARHIDLSLGHRQATVPAVGVPAADEPLPGRDGYDRRDLAQLLRHQRGAGRLRGQGGSDPHRPGRALLPAPERAKPGPGPGPGALRRGLFPVCRRAALLQGAAHPAGCDAGRRLQGRHCRQRSGGDGVASPGHAPGPGQRHFRGIRFRSRENGPVPPVPGGGIPLLPALGGLRRHPAGGSHELPAAYFRGGGFRYQSRQHPR